MELTGRASRRGGEWVLTDGEGKQYRLSGEALPARCEGLMVRVVGLLEDWGSSTRRPSSAFSAGGWSDPSGGLSAQVH